MFRKRAAATLISLCATVVAPIASAGPAPAEKGTAAKEPASLGETLKTLHAVGQWSVELSGMADKRAKSSAVKDYAREVVSTNAEKDAKLVEVAKKHGIELGPLDPKSEQGKSLLDRMKAEKALLSSLEGDAFDKEYMTLLTNTQQSVIHFLETSLASVKEPEMKQVLGDMLSTVQGRVKKAQDVMATVYGNRI